MGQQQLPTPRWQDPPEPLSWRPDSSVSADHPKALSLPAAQRQSFGKPTEEVREMALLQETFPGQVEEDVGTVPGAETQCQCHGKGKAGRKTDALAAMNVSC